jgi:hypothetical protein
MKEVKKETISNGNAGGNFGGNFGVTLLLFLNAGLYPAQIARNMKISKKNMKKRIQRLLVLGDITDLKTWPKRYALTDQGKAKVTPPIIHHDNPQRSPTKFYDLHAIEVSYELADKGNLPEGNVDLKGWSYYAEKFGDFSIKVHYGKKPKLIIYPPHIKGNSVIEVYSKLGLMLGSIVNVVQGRYKCEIKPETYRVERRPEVHAPHDPEGKVFEEMKLDMKGKNIEINQSGGGKFDIIGERSFENYDKMIGIFPQFMDQIEKFAQNLQEHIAAIKEIGQGIKEFNKTTLAMQKTIAPQNANLGVISHEPLAHVLIMEQVLSFVAEDRGIIREYPTMFEGAKIWLPSKVAEFLIAQNKARPL